jgi:uncharacterized protein YecE (DUF72 family)
VKFWIGCSGWQYRHWKGRFYPDDLPQKRWFEFYARHFTTVEINNSFYRFPRLKNVQAWYAAAPHGFKFSVKVNRAITHMRLFYKTERMIRDFYSIADALDDKMGCLLFQMPERLIYKPEHLSRILDQLDTRWPNVLEFRHAGWWRPDVFEALRQRGVSFCAVASAKLPSSVPPVDPTAYVRFHGGDDYSTRSLKIWARKIRGCGAEDAWVYFNNDANAYAVKNALELASIVRGTSRTRGPGSSHWD